MDRWCARATKNIDLLIQRFDLPRAQAAVRERGFTLEAYSFDFKDGTQVNRINKVDAAVNVSGAGVASRLREASELLDLCRILTKAAADGRASRPR